MKTIRLYLPILLLLLFISSLCHAQDRYELNTDWYCQPIDDTQADGHALSNPSYPLTGWMPATVPGTVLTTLLNNGKVPDPFYGMNNEKIKDIYDTGREYYTYWFVKEFEESATDGEQVWLNFRGINYSADIFLNGQKVNQTPFKGMYLRKQYNITKLLAKNGKNRLAVLVHPADHVGNPNGGQGGDGTIAKGVALQYTAGWDWIQPVRDRNTGIWDKVFIEKTGTVNLKHPHIVTLVPGTRIPGASQEPATLKVSAELQNVLDHSISGTLQYTLAGKTISQKVTLKPQETAEVALPDFTLQNPKLWWPNGYGEQHLYAIDLQFTADGAVSDREKITFGVREIQTTWNSHTRSKEIAVNGQKIFIKGGNWIISDAMLRFSKARYDAEIRFHRDMNLNLIRIWGGALPERPEFYEACDRYGMLVIQDFWMSGDCNGRWLDPKKKDDQWTRRQYPDDHGLFIESAADVVKMLRNHPSLAMWCGGNEITPPADILKALKEDVLPKLDGTRWFIDYSNSDEMSYNFKGGNGDGPYGIQDISTFWAEKTWPFNSEVGSVGTGDATSLKRFLPEENQVIPVEMDGTEKVRDEVWSYHKYIDYGNALEPYGSPEDMEDFAAKAQLVNYNQYRGLIEGFTAHMWDWYTGVIIWKTQNPWTSLRGQMYDYYLDPNASLYGLRNGSEVLHGMYDPVKGNIMIANNTFDQQHDIMLRVTAYDMQGNDQQLTQVFCYLEPTSIRLIMSLQERIKALSADEGMFLSVQLLNTDQKILSDNFYWLPDANGNYSGLQRMEKANIQATATQSAPGEVSLKLTNPSGNTVSFFNRISLVDTESGERLLPTFFSDNYVSLTPGEEKVVTVSYADLDKNSAAIEIGGWNTPLQTITIE
ncbi:glycoside hydrolase family 2 protein [Echinicola vietnamensis]|uniref:Beta-galactosidase/beta-glucuronidase n=1 Tax=Echinicola vietnamensis (strain DSM 17526 / LMG 23754 / KMM 6221) TaxID=926556 RepID=L0G5G9_ECHVK|nr:glycoside hydrolase family 2 TIM barrel-domain containing protein [Echinicola vietnamensis]AGA80080.1 beta-galactosidase/beta-glucuronidase [Echinicola vietnamensis DSM 17526]